MRHYWISVLVMLLGCAPSRITNTDIQSYLAPAYQRWYAATCAYPQVKHIALVKQPPLCKDKGIVLGCQCDGNIWISSQTLPEELFKVITHELGHALAKPTSGQKVHVGPREGVMSEFVQQQPDLITKADLDMICTNGACACRRPEQP